MGKAPTKEVQLYNGKTVRTYLKSEPVDPVKFKKIFEEKRVCVADVSRALGYGANTISSALHAGVFGAPMITALKNVYGIDYAEYAYIPEEKKPEPAKEPEPKEEKSVCADESALYYTMKLAMKDAMTEWFADNVKNLRGTIYAAIVRAKQATDSGAIAIPVGKATWTEGADRR